MENLKYEPGVFNVDGIDRARSIILMPDGQHTTDERWQIETAYILKHMTEWIPLRNASVLDWGCGIGRLAKPLIEQHGCSVLGIDISPSMRSLAVEYVNSREFISCDPDALNTLMKFGMRFDCVVAVWALQHLVNFADDLATIKKSLKPGGRLFVLNALKRFIPTSQNGQFQWIDDRVDVWLALSRELIALQIHLVETNIVPGPEAAWGIFEADANVSL